MVETTLAAPIVRRATARDNEARCDLFASVAMEADLVLSVHRDPDFDALYRMQSDEWECWVGEEAGAIEGMGSILVRDGYVAGRPTRVGYLGDLRISPRLQGRRLLTQFYGPVLSDASRRYGCDVWLTAVIASNTRALRALTGDRSRALGIPPYTLIRQFDIRAVHLTTKHRIAPSRFTVHRGRPAEVAEIAAFLDADSRRRPFGYAFDTSELERRLRDWPGLDIENFYLARNDAGVLVGCVAIWDAHAVKRTVVEAYRGKMRSVKTLYNLTARGLGFTPLPSPGGVLRYAYATHQAIPSEDPRIMRALVERIYADWRSSGLVFISFCVLENDPVGAAFSGFRVSNLSTNLYAVTLPGTEFDPAYLAAERPGFEMALV